VLLSLEDSAHQEASDHGSAAEGVSTTIVAGQHYPVPYRFGCNGMKRASKNNLLE